MVSREHIVRHHPTSTALETSRTADLIAVIALLLCIRSRVELGLRVTSVTGIRSDVLPVKTAVHPTSTVSVGGPSVRRPVVLWPSIYLETKAGKDITAQRDTVQGESVDRERVLVLRMWIAKDTGRSANALVLTKPTQPRCHRAAANLCLVKLPMDKLLPASLATAIAVCSHRPLTLRQSVLEWTILTVVHSWHGPRIAVHC
jgi:hypothetical protein